MQINKDLINVSFTPGNAGRDFLILHTLDGNVAGALATFRNPSKARSAQFIVGLNGNITQTMSEGDSAWGAANFYVNMHGINIEHEDNGNYNDPVRTDALYAASAALVADLCRRYGIPCQHVGSFTTGAYGGATYAKVPAQRGLVLHKEVSLTGTDCPDGLDWGRIIRQAQAILGGAAPVPPAVPAAAEVHVNYVPLNDAVDVNIGVLLVRTEPNTDSAAGQANTPDGALHAGNRITITGFTHAEDVDYSGNGGKHTDVWLRSVWGHWLWAGGTDFDLAKAGSVAAAPAVEASAPAPAPVAAQPAEYTPASGVVAVTATDGVHVRTAPTGTSELATQHAPNGLLVPGVTFNITGFTTGQDPYGDGRNIWLRSSYGNWVWAGATNFTAPAPATQVPVSTEVDKPVEAAATPVAPVQNPGLGVVDSISAQPKASQTVVAAAQPVAAVETTGGEKAAATVGIVSGFINSIIKSFAAFFGGKK